MVMKRPEILAPAGNPEKLKTALHFGADSVYLGMKDFSLRAGVGNFDEDELEWAITYAHELGRKVYVALNIQPFDSDFERIELALKRLVLLQPDAVIIADPGVLARAQKVASSLTLHLSTQASVTNAEAARFWLAQGIRRIIVARELSLEQLGALAGDCGGEIEAFVHGAVCIAYSGRCLLSLYWADRDPRRGRCAQACRWSYTEIVDRRRPDEGNLVEEDERGTYFFDAKDLCALPVLERLVNTGVRALKIEGRTRSAYYVAQTVDIYRKAVEEITNGDFEAFDNNRDLYLDELARPHHRGFSTHFLTGEHNDASSYNRGGSFTSVHNEFVGRVVATRSNGVLVKITNPIRPDQKLEIRDRGLVIEPVVAAPLLNQDGKEIDIAHTGSTVLLPGKFKSGIEAIVRKAKVDTQ